MLKNLSGEKEEIVEPMVVNKVSNSFVKDLETQFQVILLL